MSSFTRSGRNNAEVDMLSLTHIECLILAQAVWEMGSNSWPAVAKILSKHPLISRQNFFYTAQSCSFIYNNLMKQAGLDASGGSEIHAAVNLQLAQTHYEARIRELRDQIATEESHFKELEAEIEMLRSGSADQTVMEGKPIRTQEEIISPPATTLSPATDTKTDASEEKAPEAPLRVNTPPSNLSPHPEPMPEQQSVVIVTHSASLESAEVVHLTINEHPKTPDIADPIEPTTSSPNKDKKIDSPSPEEDVSSKQDTVDDEAHNPDEDGESSGDEPLQATRRSTRQRRLSAVAPPVKASRPKRGRRSETTPVQDVDVPVLTPEAEDGDSPIPDVPRASRSSKRKYSTDEDHPRKRAREESEPAEEDEQGAPSGTRTRRSTKESQAAQKRFQSVIGLLHSQISQHRNGNIFHNPIKKSEAPDYYDIVKRPMDLKTIKTRIKEGHVTNSSEYQRDIYLMFANATMYNRPNSDVYSMGKEMMLESEKHIQAYRQTEGFASLRRT